VAVFAEFLCKNFEGCFRWLSDNLVTIFFEYDCGAVVDCADVCNVFEAL
jgi:hypothetical protein